MPNDPTQKVESQQSHALLWRPGPWEAPEIANRKHRGAIALPRCCAGTGFWNARHNSPDTENAHVRTSLHGMRRCTLSWMSSASPLLLSLGQNHSQAAKEWPQEGTHVPSGSASNRGEAPFYVVCGVGFGRYGPGQKGVDAGLCSVPLGTSGHSKRVQASSPSQPIPTGRPKHSWSHPLPIPACSMRPDWREVPCLHWEHEGAMACGWCTRPFLVTFGNLGHVWLFACIRQQRSESYFKKICKVTNLARMIIHVPFHYLI